MADSTLVAVPPDVSDEEALLLGDILSTGYFCAESAGIAQLAARAAAGAEPSIADGPSKAAGPVVAVVGCGPVALLAILCEWPP
jgi:threonine dehydrogenase-like Zn-dependent dehydrogenase